MRKTILQPVSVSGVGLHTGAPSVMTFKPAEDGIHFIRTDIAGSLPIKADLNHVGSTLRGTNLKNDTAEVWTVEHVLSALNALGITDLTVEMDGPEPPVTDGSAGVYLEHLQKAGLKELSGEVPVLNLNQPVTYSFGPISYSAEPADKLTFYVFAFTAAFLLLGAHLGGGLQAAPDWKSDLNLTLLALIPTVISNLALVEAIKRIGSTFSSVLGAMEPLTAMAVGVWVFHEPFTRTTAWGTALIIAAVTLVVLAPSLEKGYRTGKFLYITKVKGIHPNITPYH